MPPNVAPRQLCISPLLASTVQVQVLVALQCPAIPYSAGIAAVPMNNRTAICAIIRSAMPNPNPLTSRQIADEAGTTTSDYHFKEVLKK
jgi:hypothetical protein